MKIEMYLGKMLDVTESVVVKNNKSIKRIEIISANENGIVSVRINKNIGYKTEDMIEEISSVFSDRGFKNISIDKKTDLSVWISVNVS